MPPKPTLPLIILFLSCGPLFAQPPTLNFHHLTPADGLSDSDVHDILQDRRDFIWLATRHGLNRYDGQQRAAIQFEKVLHGNPEDRYAQRFLQKATLHTPEGVPDDWTGVEVVN